MGGAHPPPGLLRGGVSRRAVRCAHARRQGRPRPPQPHGAPHRQRDPRRVLRGRRRHRDDQHVHRHVDRSGGLCAPGRRRGDEPGGRAAGARGRGRMDGPHAGQAPVRRGFRRPAQCHAVPVTEGGRSRLPRRQVRPGSRGLRGADRRAARRRRRPADGRDDLRHAERKGGDRRRPRGRTGAASLALVHRDRQERAQSLRADVGGVLDLGRARGAVHRRRELLARRNRDEALPGGARERRVDLRLVPPERRAAERARAARRAGRGHEPLPARVRGGRAREPRRRLLRDDARAHTCDCARRRRPTPANGPPALGTASLLGTRAIHDPTGHGLRRRRRAHQRDGVALDFGD